MAYSEYATTTTMTQILTQPPATPKLILVSDRRVTEIDLYWEAVDGATSYILEQAGNYAGTWTPVYNGPDLAATASGLTPGTRYFFRLFAVNESGPSGQSPMLLVRTRPIPEPVNGLETWSVVKRMAQKFEAKTEVTGCRL